MKNMESEGYSYIGYIGHKQHLLQYDKSKNYEVWFANKNHASYGLVFKNTHLEFAHGITTADDARQLAIDWQANLEDRNYGYGDLAHWAGVFTELGKKYDLTDEFKENGIL